MGYKIREIILEDEKGIRMTLTYEELVGTDMLMLGMKKLKVNP